MMLSNTAGKPIDLSDTQRTDRATRRLITRKIWLPKAIYAALPFFYIFSGIAALLATLYISHWLWVLPHYLLFAGGCLHMGVIVYRRRHRQDRP